MAEAAIQQEKTASSENASLQDSKPKVSAAGELDSAATLIASKPVEDKPAGPPPPPDGGLKAWLQVFGGFLLVLNTWYEFLRDITAVKS